MCPRDALQRGLLKSVTPVPGPQSLSVLLRLLHFPILCSDNPNYGLPALTSLTAASEASGSAEDDTRLYTCWPGATGGLYYLTGVCGN